MNILGLCIGESCCAALMIDGEIVAAAHEERFTRKKLYSGFPSRSIEYCLTHAGLKIDKIDKFAVMNLRSPGLKYAIVQRWNSFSAKDYIREEHEYWYPMLYESKDVNYLQVFEDKIDFSTFPGEFNKIFYEELKGKGDNPAHLSQELRTKLIQMYYPSVLTSQVEYFDHHLTHLFYGYYASPFYNSSDPVLVISADSSGDGRNGVISIFQNGRFKIVHSVSNHNLGRLYRHVTVYLGMKPYQHEYKVMGMAPYAPEYLAQEAYNVFAETLQNDGIDFKYLTYPTDNYFFFKDKLEGIRFDGVAAGLQRFFEERLLNWIAAGIKKFGIGKLSFCGGLSMNIKLNMLLLELDLLDDFFVAASCDDNSHCMGLCFKAMADYCVDNKLPLKKVKPLQSMYLGPEIDKRQLKEAITSLRNKNVKIKEKVSAGFIAKKLAKGFIIGRCSGRMEYGARALGNRSILCDPRNRDNIRRLNSIVKRRDFWMPFAPTILDSVSDEYLINPKKVTSPYMSLAFRSTEKARKDIPAALHPADFTTRPQILTHSDNPDYYAIIEAFRKITNIGAVVNTSFNIHGQPIVCSAKDAVDVFLQTGLDALLLNCSYIEKNSIEQEC